MSLYSTEDVADMLLPFHGGVSHTEVDLSSVLNVAVLSFFSNLHSTVEMLCTGLIIYLLSEEFSELHEGTRLSFAVLKLVREFKVTFNEHLQLLLVHLGVGLFSSNLTQVTDGNGLSSN
jgi:cytochrome c biogenesis factor